MITLTEPNPPDIIEALSVAITRVRNVRPKELHEQVRYMYNWNDVAMRTERVYRQVLGNRNEPLSARLRRYYDCGPVAGPLFCGVISLTYLYYRFIDWLMPRDQIDLAIDFPDDLFADLDDNDFSCGPEHPDP